MNESQNSSPVQIRSKSFNMSAKSSDKALLKFILISQLPSNIQVHIRIRPLIIIETSKSTTKIINIPNEKQIIIGNDREYNFDIIYNEDTHQENIFNNSIKPNLDKSIEGYNSCFFAYGQTGSGKTYTMGTNYSKGMIEDDSFGLLPRSLKYLFEISKNDPENEYIFRISFIEIYNDDIRDLLNIKIPSKAFSLREDNFNQVFISGLTESVVMDLEESLNILINGVKNRKTAATESNFSSSRSHAIFSVNVDKINKTTKNKTIFKINFVDLAGSERMKKSGSTGERLKESVSINSGLLSLSKVIMALADQKKTKTSHIPYRDSKLTRILKDSLGGNSITVMLACISPSEINIDESINTLNYASFAKSIKMKPLKYSEYSNATNENLQMQIEKLKEELEKCKLNSLFIENKKLKSLLSTMKIDIKGNFTPIDIHSPCDFSEDKENILNNSDDCDLENKYSRKVQECLDLINENNQLKDINKALNDRESELLQKISELKSGKSNDYPLKNSKYDSLDNLILSPNVEVNNLILFDGKDIDDKIPNFDENFKNINRNDMGKLLDSPKTKMIESDSRKKKLDNDMQMISEKIKKLKDFQNNLQVKIIENEQYKTKFLQQKCSELDLINKETYESTKIVKNIESIQTKTKDSIESTHKDFLKLKGEIRNKSMEFKNKSINKTDESLIKTRNNSVSCERNDIRNSSLNLVSPLDPDIIFLNSIKNLTNNLELSILQKLKIEKKIKLIVKEQEEFLNTISKYENRFLNKIHLIEDSLAKSEYELNKFDKNSNNKDKSQIFKNQKDFKAKLEKLKERMSKIWEVKQNTSNEMKIKENELNLQLQTINENINELKNQINFNKVNANKNSSKLRNYEVNYDSEINQSIITQKNNNISTNNKINSKEISTPVLNIISSNSIIKNDDDLTPNKTKENLKASKELKKKPSLKTFRKITDGYQKDNSCFIKKLFENRISKNNTSSTRSQNILK